MMSSNSVWDHTRDQYIRLPLRGCPILFITRTLWTPPAVLPLLIVSPCEDEQHRIENRSTCLALSMVDAGAREGELAKTRTQIHSACLVLLPVELKYKWRNYDYYGI